MPSTTMLKNYSKCPLKKRPVHFTFDNSENKDEPENLCIKKEVINNNNINSNDNKNKISQIIIKKEIISNHIEDGEKMITSSSSVIIPTPTYPKIALQPWNFHLPPYSSDFYRTITNHNSFNHHHQQQQQQQQHHHLHNNHHHQHHHSNQNYLHHDHSQPISPIRNDLHSPSSPSEGSLSPPPHYLHGRANSISPPMNHEIYHPIGMKQNNNSHIIKPEVISSNRYIPYNHHHHHHQVPYQPYSLCLNNQPPPISPTYSETSSYYSMRSITPEMNNCISPEDLSIKHTPSESNFITNDNHNKNNNSNSNNNNSIKIKTEIKEKLTPPRYQCIDCNKSYSTFSGLTKHQQFHCPAAEGNQIKKSFSCKDCDKTYVSLGALKMHIRTHTLPCKCTICGKAFSRPWLLQGHIRTHTGEKPFSCQHCHRAFADRSNLRAHLQTHSDIKKYSCSTCSKTFSRMSLLTKHNEGGCPGINGVSCNSPSSSYIESYQD